MVFLLMVLLSLHRLGNLPEHAALDFLYTLRPAQPAPPEVLIVGIDEPSFQEVGQAWPWPRRLHATLIRRLSHAGARLIVLDIVFAEPSTPEDDQAMAEAIRQSGKVVMAQDLEIVRDAQFSREILVQPYKPFRQAALGMGLALVSTDPDGVVRQFRWQFKGIDTLAATVLRNLQPQFSPPPEGARLIDFVGPPRSLDSVSYYQVIDPAHPLPESRIRDRVVLVGRMVGASPAPQARSDSFYTPYYAWSGQVTTGVEIQGQIIHTLLSATWGRELSLPTRLWLYLGVFLLAAYGLSRLKPLAGLGVLLGTAAALCATSALLFLVWRLWVPPVLLLAGITVIYGVNVLDRYLAEAREKRWLRMAFSRYLSPSVVELIVAQPERLQLGGEEVEGTVLFADLAGFTALSENMTPRAVIGLLNEYFSPLTDIILAHQGTLDKYIGDALMAFWGAPLARPDHAELACRAAIAMQLAMQNQRDVWQARNLPRLQTRIGLHSGPLIAGNVGSRERLNYTVLGDTVNLASRLEGVNKIYGTNILVSESCKHLVANHFLLRELDVIQVPGRDQAVAVYELLAEATDFPPAWLAVFAAGREYYQRQDWAQAIRCFQEVLRLNPEDRAALLFLNRVLHYQANPPPPEWQGVFVISQK